MKVRALGRILVGLMCIGTLVFSGGVAVRAQEEKEEQKPANIEQLEEQVKAMREAIDLASKRLEDANRPAEERVKELQDLIAVAQTAKDDLSDGGKLFEELKKAITLTEEKQKEWKDKSNDPEISAKIRQQYDRLSAKFTELTEELYDKQILINRQRDELDDNIKEWGDQKGFISDLILAGEIETANQALLDVLDTVKTVNESFADFAKNFAGEEMEAETEQSK